MAEITKIQWCDATLNPWIGCTKVSPACDDCYAAVSTPVRAMGIEWGAGKPRHRTSASTWRQPLVWNRQHAEFFAEHGRRRRVFCASLADVFDNEVPVQWRAELFALIHDTPNLDWLLLTKRIGNMQKMSEETADWHFDYGDRNVAGWLTDWYKRGIAPANVWLGSTIANQEEADRDIPKLLRTPARVRFLSCEPLLGAINLGCAGCGTVTDVHSLACTHMGRTHLAGIDWVIVGGESGGGARSMTIGWAKDLRRQCAIAGVAFFMKQLGSRPVNREGLAHPVSDRKGGLMHEWPEELRVREFPR